MTSFTRVDDEIIVQVSSRTHYRFLSKLANHITLFLILLMHVMNATLQRDQK